MEPHHHSPLPIFLLHEQDLLKMNIWLKKTSMIFNLFQHGIHNKFRLTRHKSR